MKTQLLPRDFRRGVFALFSTSVESAEQFLSPLVGKASGLIVTLGPVPLWELRAPGLYHLETPRESASLLVWLLPPLLLLIEKEAGEKESRKVCEMDLDRMKDDLKRLVDQSYDTSRLLSSELSVRRGVEKSLEESKKWFRTILDSVNDAVLVHDAKTGELLDVNMRTCDLYGYSREETLQKGLMCMISNVGTYDHAHALEHIHQVASDHPVTFEWHARHKSGRLFWVEVSLRAAELLGKACVLASARDITDRKIAEEHRKKVELQMQHTQKLESLGVMAGGIAHDFNNLLMTILGNADMALMDMSPGASSRGNLNEIIKASRRAADLCSQMLAYAGKGRFVIRNVDLNEMISGMNKMLEMSVSKKAVLRFNYGLNLPPVLADTTQLQQIVMNLVINASEAIGDREGVITVSTGKLQCDPAYFQDALTGGERDGGDYVFMEVRDTGSGIKSEDILKIFEPFYTTKFTGRGLGLAAVQGIVNSHKGAMKVFSKEGSGTNFTILLPAVAGSCVPAEVCQLHEGGGVRRGTVLLVDDDESVRVMTDKMLKALGYDVITADDGEQAVEIVRSGTTHISCILMDLNMPKMNGEEAYREIHRLDKALPVIISSGYAEQEIAEQFMGKGAVGVIQKPYQMLALRHKIDETLRMAGLAATR